jgi:uncharacterized membrane protein
MTINETKKINVNEDNYYDLQIFLKDIRGSFVDLIVKGIHEEVSAEEQEEREEESKIEEENKWWYLVIVVVIILLIILFFNRKKGIKSL